MLTAQWNTGYIVATAILGGLAVIFAGLSVVSFILWRHSSDRELSVAGFGAVGSGILGFIFAGVMIFVLFPFAGVYHEYVPVSGTVQQVQTRFLGDGSGGTSQYFMVQIAGQPYRCDDTRCTQLQKGSQVTLMCERQWIANGTPAYVCNWGKLGLNT